MILNVSQPVASAFQVWDLDHCCRKDLQSGRGFASVFCVNGDGPFDEDSVTEIDSWGPVNGVVGFEGKVIRRVREVAANASDAA